MNELPSVDPDFRREVDRRFRRVDNDVHEVYHTIRDISTVQKEHGRRLDGISRTLTAVHGEQRRQATRLDKVEGRLGNVEGRLDTIDGRLDTIDGRLDTMDGRFESMDGRFESMDSKLDRVLTLLEPPQR